MTPEFKLSVAISYLTRIAKVESEDPMPNGAYFAGVMNGLRSAGDLARTGLDELAAYSTAPRPTRKRTPPALPEVKP